nr:hypothetical protein Iba_chr01dCG2150 [Ipomoea batatas]
MARIWENFSNCFLRQERSRGDQRPFRIRFAAAGVGRRQSLSCFLSVTKKCCKREALHHQISSSPSSSMLRCHHHHCFAVAEGPANCFFNALEESILYSSLFPHKNIAIVSRTIPFSASQFSAIFPIPNLPPLFQERKEKKNVSRLLFEPRERICERKAQDSCTA